jgi:serralysin
MKPEPTTMATFKFFKALSGHGLLPVFYDRNTMEATDAGATSVTYADAQGDRIVFTGENLAVAARADGDPVITGVQYFNKDGARLLSVTGLKVDPADLTYTDAFEDILLLQAGRDRFIGSAKADVMLYGQNPGKDILLGKGGDDRLLASSGNNVYDGGNGLDTLSFENTFPLSRADARATTGVQVDLTRGRVDNAWGGTDRVRNIEAVGGTPDDDIFIGSKAKKEYFTGYGGDDTFTGRGGRDIFDFTSGDGHDTFTDFGKSDRVVIYGYLGEIGDFDGLKDMMDKVGHDVVLTLSDTDSLTFLDTKIAELSARQFDMPF